MKIVKIKARPDGDHFLIEVAASCPFLDDRQGTVVRRHLTDAVTYSSQLVGGILVFDDHIKLTHKDRRMEARIFMRVKSRAKEIVARLLERFRDFEYDKISSAVKEM